MIATLRGEVTQVEENAIIIETGGVGLRVFVPKPLRDRTKAGEAIFLFTHVVIREDDWKLFGFESQADRELFTILLGVDGVGPEDSLGGPFDLKIWKRSKELSLVTNPIY